MVTTWGKSGRSREAHEETSRRPGRRGRCSTRVAGQVEGVGSGVFCK